MSPSTLPPALPCPLIHLATRRAIKRKAPKAPRAPRREAPSNTQCSALRLLARVPRARAPVVPRYGGPTYRDVEHAYDFLPTRPVRTPEEFQRFVRHAALVAVPGHGPCAPCAAPGEERVRQTQGTERAEGPEERGKNPHTQPPASDRRASPQEQNPNIYHIGNTNNNHQDMNENERKRRGIAASRL